MATLFFILAIILFIIYILLHRSADKIKKNIKNSPLVISDPSKDLTFDQKYAIVCFQSFIAGASMISAADLEVDAIMQSTILSLGLSKEEVQKYYKLSMLQDTNKELLRFIRAFKSINDRNYLKEYQEKCMKVAYISENNETIEGTKQIFNQLGL